MKQLLLKRNKTALEVAIFILVILYSGIVFAQENITKEQSKHITKTKTEDTNDDSPFSVGHPPIPEKKAEETSNNRTNINDSSIKIEAKDKATNNEISPTTNGDTPAIAPQNNYKTGVMLQGLNKITARTSKSEVKIDQPIKFGNLSITLHACWKSPPEEAPESKALLDMWEEIPGESRKKIFSGWMFASSPLISAPEHPVYDVTVLECTGEPFVKTEESVRTEPLKN